MSTGKLAGRLALITGASRGLGAALARRFAAEGADLILLGRTQGGLEEADDAVRAAGGKATLVPIDLADGDAIDAMGYALFQRFGKLDILVGNAALLGTLSPIGHLEPKLWDQVMAVNLTANWRLIRGFDRLLRASPAGRAIFVTCAAARDRAPFWGPYAASKAGLETLALGWAEEVGRITNLRVNLIDPGPMRTRMRAQAFPGETPHIHPEPAALTDIFVELASAGCQRNGEILGVD